MRPMDQAAARLRELIRTHLDASGLSPRAASLSAGLSPNFIRDIFAERTKLPREDNLRALGEVLGLSDDWYSHIFVANTKTVDVTFPKEEVGSVPMNAKIKDGNYRMLEQAAVAVPAPPEGVEAAMVVADDALFPVYRRGDTVYRGPWTEDVHALVGLDILADLGGDVVWLARFDSVVQGGQCFLSFYGARPPAVHRVLRAAPLLWVKRA